MKDHKARSLQSMALLTVVVCCVINNVSAQRHGDCMSLISGGRVAGQCIAIRQCELFMNILTKINISESERNLLQVNQCNIQASGDVNVCCPLDTSIKLGKDGLGALRHPLLPYDCGAFKWQRSNDSETKINEFPWVVLIEYTKPNQEKIHACGGVLISGRYVLTAAHCVAGPAISKQGWRVNAVRLGEWDTLTNPDCQVSHAPEKTECAPPYHDALVEQIVVHPLYNKDGLNQANDIALIRMKEVAQFNDYTQPICLPNKQLRADELEDLVTEVAGWKARNSSRLKKSEVIIESIEKCQKQYAAQNIQIISSQLCGAALANDCFGNAGGPLMLFKNNAYLLGGLLSFGPVPCPSPDWPDIYTRVASYIDWIHENLKS